MRWHLTAHLPRSDHTRANQPRHGTPCGNRWTPGALIGWPLLMISIVVGVLGAVVRPVAAQEETYSGNGDDVVRIEKPSADRPALLVIQGNQQGRHFAVIGYTASRERTGVLVNTTDPYSGIVPLDLPPTENTALLEVSATGPWSIDVYPIGAAQQVEVPGSFDGEGDRVLWIDGEPSTADISGNRAGRHFAVIAYGRYGNGQGVLVNTTNSYDGTVLLPRDVLLLEVTGTGSWTIRLE